MDFHQYDGVEQRQSAVYSELAQQHALNDKNDTHKNENENEEDVKFENNNLIFSINLGDPIKSVSEKYEYNFGLLLAIVLSAATLSFGNAALAFYTATGQSNTFYRYLTVCYFIGLLLGCITVIIIAKGHRKFTETFIHSLNRLITIKPPSTIYDIYQLQYIPFWFLIATIYCCFLGILEQTYYYNLSVSYTQKCIIDITQSQCLVVGASFITSYQMIAAFGFFGLIQLVKCNQIIAKERMKIEEKYAITKIIISQIEERLTKWKLNKQFKNRKFELFVVFCLFFAGTFMVHAVIRVNIFSGNYHPGAVIYGLLIYTLDSILITFVIGILLTPIWHHYEFLSIIMDELSQPISTNNIFDIIGWWELRKYYVYCVTNVYTATLRYVSFGSLAGAIICTSTYFLGPRLGLRPDVLFIFLCGAVCMIIVKFLIVSQATSYHKILLSHTHSINKERLKFDANELMSYSNNNNNNNKDKIIILRNIIFDRIIQDIVNNSHPISVLGVRMDANFMLFLRASAITVGVAILIEG